MITCTFAGHREVFGSCITFGADGAVSAPGQMQMERLAAVLDALHESMCQENSAKI